MIEMSFPRHKVEYDDLANMVDVELDSMIQEAEEDGHLTREDVDDAKQVLEHYKNRLEKRCTE